MNAASTGLALLVLFAALPPGVEQVGATGYRSAQDGAELVLIPEANHRLGDSDGRYDEIPEVSVHLSAFFIDRYEVSNDRYAAFVRRGRYHPRGPWRRGFSPGEAQLPVRFITWEDARAYCLWAGRELPTEAQWEAAGGEARFVWGDQWEPDRALTSRGVDQGPAAVEVGRDSGATGVVNQSGNVREWVFDWYDRYRYRGYAAGETPVDPRGPINGEAAEPHFVATDNVAGNERSTRRVVRGASWVAQSPDASRLAHRDAHNPAHWFNDVGFRCAIGAGGSR